MYPKGKKHSKKTKKKISQTLKRLHNEGKLEWLFKKGNIPWNKGKKTGPLSEEHKRKIKRTMKKRDCSILRKYGKNAAMIHYARILKAKEEFEQQGFRCIPFGKVIPDMIAIKNGKIFAVEIEYNIPKYDKYIPEIMQFYDDVIWIIKKREKR